MTASARPPSRRPAAGSAPHRRTVRGGCALALVAAIAAGHAHALSATQVAAGSPPGGTPSSDTASPAPAATVRDGAAPTRTEPRPFARPARKTAPPAPSFGGRDDVHTFVRAMVERHGFDEAALLALFARTRSAESAIAFMQPAPPGPRRSWTAYRGRFVEPLRIREGLRFWRENADAVRRAAERYAVPAEILVAIIGVETIYGRQTGEFRVMDALSTLAFDYPRRAEYFKEELEQYLLLAREAGFDPLDRRGSFAGAIGLPQFMPGSIRRHAVDFDGDDRIDLRGSPADAIGSVARFLADHGWTAGTPTHFPAKVADDARARPAVDAGIPPSLSVARLAELGVTGPPDVPADATFALIDLPDGDDPTQYVLGANNFYVITRYNRSYFYAMAVIDLARALRDAQPGAQARASR